MTTENVAILFTDIVGSTALSQRLSAEVADEVRRSSDAVIALYAELEKLAPRPAGDILLLM